MLKLYAARKRFFGEITCWTVLWQEFYGRLEEKTLRSNPDSLSSAWNPGRSHGTLLFFFPALSSLLLKNVCHVARFARVGIMLGERVMQAIQKGKPSHLGRAGQRGRYPVSSSDSWFPAQELKQELYAIILLTYSFFKFFLLLYHPELDWVHFSESCVWGGVGGECKGSNQQKTGCRWAGNKEVGQAEWWDAKGFASQCLVVCYRHSLPSWWSEPVCTPDAYLR